MWDFYPVKPPFVKLRLTIRQLAFANPSTLLGFAMVLAISHELGSIGTSSFMRVNRSVLLLSVGRPP